MPAVQKAKQKQPGSGGTNYANPMVQQDVNAPNESSMNEVDSDISEEDEYDDNEDESLKHFTQPPRMPPYDFAKRKLSQLIELMNGPYLDLAPHYQRDVVWTRKAMRLLIDSMRNGYYIPPVIFNVTEMTDQHGTVRFKRTCVDGKQRLTSIRDFLNGKFPCKIGKKLWYFCDENGTPRKGNRKKVLPDAARENFMKIEVLCTEYKGLTQTQEIELFQRVQLGKPLTQAEAFRATQGSWQEFAKLYEKDFADVVNLVKQNRASGFRGILTCFSQIYECLDPSHESGVPRLRNSMKSLELLCSNSQSLDTVTKSHLRSVFETFQDLVDMDRTIFENHGYTRTKTFSPVELIGVCCLLSQKMERPIGMLRGDILAMRAYLREIYSDLRVNKECWASIWTFIEELEGRRGAIDGSTVEKRTWKTVGRPRQPRTTQTQAASSSHRSSSSNNPRTSDGVLQDSSRHANTNPIRSSTSRWGMVDRTGQSARIDSLVAYPDGRNSEGTSPNDLEQANEDKSRDGLQHRGTGRELVANSRDQLEAPSAGSLHQPLSTTNTSVDGVERAVSRDNTVLVPRMASEPSSVTPTYRDNAALGSATAPPASRKRLALDLGGNSNDVLALEAKRVRLRAGIVKQEKE